jgi:hypothetical protein
MESGWRLFAELWDTQEPDALLNHATLFPSLAVVEKVAAYPDAVLNFEIDSQRFAVVRSQGEYLFFVEDPECRSDLLLAVAQHFNSLLRPIQSLNVPH